MAEINARDIASKGAIEAPLLIKKNIDELIKSIDKFLKISRQSEANISVAKSIIQINNETVKLTKAQNGLAESTKKVSLNAKTLISDSQKEVEAYRKVQSGSKGVISVREALIKTGAELADTNKKVTNSIKEQDRAFSSASKILNGISGEYKKLTERLNEARNKYKDFAASGLSSESALKRQQKVVEELNRKVVAIDNAVGQFQRNVGNYPAVFGAATKTLIEFLSAFGLIGGIYLFAKALKDVVALSIEFESANSRLAGVMGKTKSEIDDLRKQQIELAKTTLYNAAAYAELQIELAKLGFPIEDIEKMTESTAKASIAMGSDLARQAELTGSVLHQYGLEANQVERINDALSKSTTSSALDFEKLATALPYVGSNAALLGFNLEETLAIMGQLANAGLQASTIGTSLRNIFLRLADSSSALSKKFGEPVRDLPSFINGLKQLKASGTDLGEALELTDRRAVSAFATLIDGADKVEALNKVIDDSTGFTNELAKTVKDNLGGDLKLAGSAVAALAIAIGQELEGAMRAVVQVFTGFVRLLVDVPKFLKENKDLIWALVLALVAFNQQLIITNLNLLVTRLSTISLIDGFTKLFARVKALWALMAANPVGVTLLAISALIVGLNILEKTYGKTARITAESTKINSRLEQSYKDLNTALSELTVTESEYSRLTEKQKKDRIDLIKLKIADAEASIREGEASLALLRVKARELSLGQQNRVLKLRELGQTEQAIALEKEMMNQNAENNEAYKESVKATTDNIMKLNELRIGLQETITDYADLEEQVKANTLAQKNAQTITDDRKRLDMLQKLREEYLKLDNQRLKGAIDISKRISDNDNQSLVAREKELEAQESFFKKIAQNEFELSMQKQRKYDEDKALIIKETELRVSAINKNKLSEEEYQSARASIVKEGFNKIAELEAMNNAEITSAKEKLQKELTDIEIEGQNERARIAYEYQLKQINKAKEDSIKEAEERISARKVEMDNEITLIQKQYLAGELSKKKADEKIEQLEKDHREALIKEAIKYQEILLQIEKKQLEESIEAVNSSKAEEADKKAAIAALTKLYGDREKEILREIYDLGLSLSDAQYDNKESLFEKEIEFLEDLFDAVTVYGNAIANLFGAISDRRMAQIDQEARALKDFYDEQMILAGDNERAKDQLRLQEQKREEQLERRRIAAMRKAAVFEKALGITQAGIQTALNILKVFPNPVLMALAGTLGALQIAAIAAKPIPKYAEGTPLGGHSGGPAIVGEEGTELGVTPSGKMFLTPGKATTMNLPKGTEIIPHDETMRMLANGSINKIDSVTPQYALNRKIESLEMAIKKGNTEVVDAIVESRVDYFMQASVLMKAQHLKDGSRKITRARSMNS